MNDRITRNEEKALAQKPQNEMNEENVIEDGSKTSLVNLLSQMSRAGVDLTELDSAYKNQDNFLEGEFERVDDVRKVKDL